ncbi:protein NipSnap homolog 3A-like isoform X4 [Erinaceus europaeus]|uniref:Protein NipSnap homolog 3A-like isoform X4 n=1 Tax=Erinaceus europaeus TaxID=9365 RepID=A0ABM3Y1V4_ERIEU|nr:protein NipSnap homolog 3A-like isoform X4 [Erinaceus europaeus]
MGPLQKCSGLSARGVQCKDQHKDPGSSLPAPHLQGSHFIGSEAGAKQYDETIYEFRTYSLKSSKMNEFLENFKRNVHLRTSHSELVGYWSVEFGGRLNKAFHIWKYGIYEMVIFQMKPGGPLLWEEALKKAIHAYASQGYSKLIGVFHTDYGALDRGTVGFFYEVHVLWWYENADNRAAGRHRSHEDPRVVAAVQESVSYLVSQQNMLLIPTSFSPLK